jgi:hypothetical protein
LVAAPEPTLVGDRRFDRGRGIDLAVLLDQVDKSRPEVGPAGDGQRVPCVERHPVQGEPRDGQDAREEATQTGQQQAGDRSHDGAHAGDDPGKEDGAEQTDEGRCEEPPDPSTRRPGVLISRGLPSRP